jgi:EAL domain-containing protein (putative c-di-GMP-specific phosphodiesterase class I)
MGSRAFDDEITATHGTGVSGVHESPTQPAPQVEDDAALIGSVPVEALGAEFQPLVDLRTGLTAGFEALPRCRAEGLADPRELYARASFEKTVGELGREMRAIAVRECVGTALYVSIHPGELKYGDLVRPDDPITQHDAPVFLQLCQPSFATLALQILGELSSRSGVSLVLDDFGAGPSSVKQLVELSPAVVKIDAELIAGIDHDRRRREAVGAVVELCERLGAETIAKGVDTGRQLQAALECGVRYAQGAVVGEPAPMPTVSHWPPVR